MGDFEFPPVHDTAPFFTIQPVASSRRKQMEMWCDLICAYCKHRRSHHIDIAEEAESDLFYNKRIDRRLSNNEILDVLDALVERGNGEWESTKDKRRCKVIWRTPAQWADIIYEWVAENGLTDTVQTVFSLHEGEESEGTEFHKLNPEVLVRALRALESQGKAQIFEGSSPGDEGVKFFTA